MVWPLLNICAAQIQQDMVRSMRLGNFTNNFKTTICGFYISYTTTTNNEKVRVYKIIFPRELHEKWYFGRITQGFSC